MDLKLILFLCFVICKSNAYKVLVVYPLPLKSVNSLGVATCKHLLEAGHEVTFMTTFPSKGELPRNFRQIDISANVEPLMTDSHLTIEHVIENPEQTNDIGYLQTVGYKLANATFENKEVQKFLQDPNEHFDVVIGDLYESELYGALATLFKCPMIWSYSIGPHWMTLRLLDQATSPAFATDYLSADFPPFNWSQRLNKLWLQIKWSFIKWTETLPKEEALYRKIFEPLLQKRGRPVPNYSEILYNASFILANDFKGNGFMPSTPQNFQLVAGYHIDVPPKALPNDIQKFLDNAQHGFIYFSMGSMWQSKDMPKSIISGLLKVFGELKQTVIWKFEDVLPDLPKNVHILKWAPQSSILAHPKCLFFITHGGHLSSIESVHFGVPIIGIPIYFDQFVNINKAVNKGYAIKVDLNMNLADGVKAAVNEMLENATYKENAKELSVVYHDRLVPPGKELVHWVEHVIKTRGAPHLKSPALMMYWYQRMFLDIAAVIITILVLISYTIRRLFCKSKKVKPGKKLD